MGRKSIQEVPEEYLLNNDELDKVLQNKLIDLNEIQTNELALSLYQFTRLIFDSTK